MMYIKYINEETGDIYLIKREIKLWKWARYFTGKSAVQNGCSIEKSWYYTRRECKEEITRQYGPIIAYSTYKKSLKNQG
jgi:hypothetical protein